MLEIFEIWENFFITNLAVKFFPIFDRLEIVIQQVENVKNQSIVQNLTRICLVVKAALNTFYFKRLIKLKDLRKAFLNFEHLPINTTMKGQV